MLLLRAKPQVAVCGVFMPQVAFGRRWQSAESSLALVCQEHAAGGRHTARLHAAGGVLPQVAVLTELRVDGMDLALECLLLEEALPIFWLVACSLLSLLTASD